MYWQFQHLLGNEEPWTQNSFLGGVQWSGNILHQQSCEQTQLHHLGVLIIYTPLANTEGAVPRLKSGELQLPHGPHNHIFYTTINGTRFLYMPDNYVEDHLVLNNGHSRYFQLYGSSTHFALCICACFDKMFPQFYIFRTVHCTIHMRERPTRCTLFLINLFQLYYPLHVSN
jgi:hypothetical protein